MSNDPIYFFGVGNEPKDAPGKEILGGKGAGLLRMAQLGIPVPPGFTITTSVCLAYQRAGGRFPDALEEQVDAAMQRIEEAVAAAGGGEKGGRFGDARHPLLFSCRSGARASMPGMMDTVLNLGLNDQTVAGLAAQGGGERFAWDCYRRLVQMYANVVLGFPHERFEAVLGEMRGEYGVQADHELPAAALQTLVARYRALLEAAGKPMPQAPRDQLLGAIEAVFKSWNNPRAQAYRKANQIPDDWGTAVNVQVMVFGNMGDDCATGVAFTRDPVTGENSLFGEYLPNAQGEDVVAGIRTPRPIHRTSADGPPSLEELMPAAYGELTRISRLLERELRDMQDIEFTIQRHKLWMLQTRTGKRSAMAAVRVGVEMVEEGLISKTEAIKRIDPNQLEQLLHPRLDPTAAVTVLAKGLPASPGAASGHVVFHPEEAEAAAAQGRHTILVRPETSPEDIRGMIAADGILTATGGMTSHAAIVSRGMGKPCVAGCGELDIDLEHNLFRVREHTVRAGDVITLDAGDGRVLLGDVPRVPPSFEGPVTTVMAWADEVRRLQVWTNADTPHDAEVGRAFGAEGIGLCRTEHMFFAADRIDRVRQMILAQGAEERAPSLAELEEMQRADFEGIFQAMDGLPVTIRLLDPPLHEFLPHDPGEMAQLAERLGLPPEDVARRIHALAEFNPMLGLRGVRVGITAPEIYGMQARAILRAAVAMEAKGCRVHPEIMVPLVATRAELARIRELVVAEAETLFENAGRRVVYQVGTMIELPRACVVAGEIAAEADFFSFGTNDLTQTTFGLSRDDAGWFLGIYRQKKLLPQDPFVSIDVDGVGVLMAMAVRDGRARRPGLKVGICGEHGGEPASVAFCHRLGLDYVSCSPYRVPVARMAAAQAALAEG